MGVKAIMKPITLITQALNAANWKFKNIEHWKDNLFTVTPNAGSDITLSVNEFKSHYAVELFATSNFRCKPFSSCLIYKMGKVINIDGETE